MKSKNKRSDKIYIYGKHALKEALISAPHTIRKVYLAKTIEDEGMKRLLAEHEITVAQLEVGKGRSMSGTEAHQGVIAIIDTSTLMLSLDAFLDGLNMETKPAVAVLGEVQDPHNVGAIIRSAAAFGFAGVLIPEHNQAPITGTVVKTSAGMTFRVPLIKIGNVNTSLRTLKEKGFWIYGLAADGDTSLEAEEFDAPTAIVVGNESTGIREKTLETCDVALSIPMHSRAESLNASVSAALVFHAWSTHHTEALS